MILIIPTTNKNLYYKYNITIENKSYILIFHYNGRMGRWVLSIYDYREVPILTGLALLLGIDLLAGMANENLPPGRLMWYSSIDLYEEGGITSPGNTHFLLYEEAT